MSPFPTRRSVLATLLALPSFPALADKHRSLPLAGLLDPTPACGEDPTPEQTAGPFYTPDVPLKYDLSNDTDEGQPMTLLGFVLDRNCRPLPGALVEIWHADSHGTYDNQGHRLRGHQLTDDRGRWGFETIVTQHYAFRTAHYHFRVRREDGSILTTQLYFPDHPRNASDPYFDPRLLLTISQRAGRGIGRYDFVV